MLKDIRKRNFLKTMIASSLLPVIGVSELKAEEINSFSPINIIISKNYAPSLAMPDQYRLIRATLNFLEVNFRGGNLPLWGKKFEEIDLERRLVGIVDWIARGIQKYKDIYPVDPVWIVAQMMLESFFYEFTVSRALAVGVCQFIQPTAHEYDMLCAGDLPGHSKSPYHLPEFANEVSSYYRLKKGKSKYRKEHKPAKLNLKECLEIIAENECHKKMEQARQYLNYEKKLEEFDKKKEESKKRYKEYIQANTKDKSIFDDARFLEQLDERLTYRKSIPAMVKMIAKNLRARNGNILAAAAGYQAGLSRTRDIGFYKAYGKIPNIQSTVDYLSHIIIVHNEITKRIDRA